MTQRRQPHCCPGCDCEQHTPQARREFLGTVGLSVISLAALGGTMLHGVTWASLSEENASEIPMPPARRALKVLPVFLYDQPQYHEAGSWRSWGGVQTQADAEQEKAAIAAEMEKITKEADFPIEFLPLVSGGDVNAILDPAAVEAADTILCWPAGGNVHGIEKFNKPTIFFIRHESGPISLWYEIISPRYLRQHGDSAAFETIRDDDVVIDDLSAVIWRLRGLCGLVNTRGTKILCVGGPAAWAQDAVATAETVKKLFQFELETIDYTEIERLVKEADADPNAVALAKERAAAYVAIPQTTLGSADTQRFDPSTIERCFMLDLIFRKLMVQAGCSAITINACMGTIMQVSKTTACLALSTLNDDGWLAFCESDFIVIPSGVLMAKITGKPVFLNDPTYPHDGIITLAHCTAPRKMDGQNHAPATITTHFESDYGSSPKVDMEVGRLTTNIAPDFGFKRWVGLHGKIVKNPFLPICRSQIDIEFTCDSQQLAERMPGFHWMTCYDDCAKELGYALRRIPITWEFLQ